MTTARRRQKTSNADIKSSGNKTAPDYKSNLWRMADALRGSMDAAEYKHVVLGLIFLKYISDAFEEAHTKLETERDEGADPEDPDEYRAQSIFWVPPEARWQYLKNKTRQPTIGRLVDDAMTAIERDNPALKDVLPKDYARPALDKTRLGQVLDLVSNIKVGGSEARATDVLGTVYEYFLEQFALAEGKKGGEFYTPRSVVRLLVGMLEPYQGRVYDPCCGSAGMFVQSVEFIRAHASGNGNGGQAKADISIYGQESNYTTWRLARMNLAVRGIEGHLAHGDTFHNDRHPDLRADYILANPHFNDSDWGGERLRDDKRWEFRRPAGGQRQLRLGATLLAPPGASRHGRFRSGQRLHVVEPVRRRRNPQEYHKSQPGGLHRRPAGTACSAPLRYPPVSGSCPGDAATGNIGTGGARRCSSTPASWATWRTGPIGTFHRRTSLALQTPTIPGGAKTGPVTTQTFPDSARARPSKRFAGTAMSLPLAATLERNPKRMTASPSRRRCPASPLNGESNRPRRSGLTQPSPRT